MEEIIKRGGKEYKVVVAVTPEGGSQLYFESVEPDPETGQKIRQFPTKLVITFDEGEGKGAIYKIETSWKTVMLTNTGKPIQQTGETINMTTAPAEIKTFTLGLGMPILRPMTNGHVRANLGFNNMPVFNAQGQVIQYTEEQENQPPTNDYYNPPIAE